MKSSTSTSITNNHVTEDINRNNTTAKTINTKNDNKNNNLLYKSLLSGSCAGITSCLLLHPMDVLRTKMQTTSHGNHSKSISSTRYLVSTIQKSFEYGGYRSFYIGLSLPLSAQALYKGTIFTIHNFSKQYLFTSSNNSNVLTTTFISGAVAGAINGGIFVTPVEYVRNQLIAQQHSQLVALSSSSSNPVKQVITGPMQVIKNTIRKSPIGLYRGVLVTIIRDGLGCGCFFTANEYILHAHEQNNPNNTSIDIVTRVVAGSMAGIAYWAIALPFDTIKTQIQTGEMKSISHFFRKLSSVKQLYSGWQVAFGRGAPAAAITIGVYDFCFSKL